MTLIDMACNYTHLTCPFLRNTVLVMHQVPTTPRRKSSFWHLTSHASLLTTLASRLTSPPHFPSRVDPHSPNSSNLIPLMKTLSNPPSSLRPRRTHSHSRPSVVGAASSGIGINTAVAVAVAAAPPRLGAPRPPPCGIRTGDARTRRRGCAAPALRAAASPAPLLHADMRFAMLFCARTWSARPAMTPAGVGTGVHVAGCLGLCVGDGVE